MHRYSSIPNKVDRDVKAAVDAAPDKVWVATPKYHGANFSFEVSTEGAGGGAGGARVRLCRRGGYLDDTEHFYGARDLGAELHDRLVALASRFEGRLVRVFGELYGGTYPHPEVPDTKARGVQPGVYYSPTVRFAAFDIRVGGLEDGEYLDFYDARCLARMFGIPFVPVHKVGHFNDILKWANEHAGDAVRVSETHGAELPLIPDNIGEGYVIRPGTRIRTPFGLASSRLKVKSDKFCEITKAKPPKKLRPLAPRHDFLNYITMARAGSVLSKEREEDVVMSNVRGLGAKLVADALEEYGTGGEVPPAVEKQAVGVACKHIAGLIRMR